MYMYIFIVKDLVYTTITFKIALTSHSLILGIVRNDYTLSLICIEMTKYKKKKNFKTVNALKCFICILGIDLIQRSSLVISLCIYIYVESMLKYLTHV